MWKIVNKRPNNFCVFHLRMIFKMIENIFALLLSKRLEKDWWELWNHLIAVIHVSFCLNDSISIWDILAINLTLMITERYKTRTWSPDCQSLLELSVENDSDLVLNLMALKYWRKIVNNDHRTGFQILLTDFVANDKKDIINPVSISVHLATVHIVSCSAYVY